MKFENDDGEFEDDDAGEDAPSEELDAIEAGKDEEEIQWGFPVILIGEGSKRKRAPGASIWNGADLKELREKLTLALPGEVGVNMTNVGYLHSGTFGAMLDWVIGGSRVYLINPHPNVQRMLWFTQHCTHLQKNVYLVHDTTVALTQESERSQIQEVVGAADEKDEI